jgi:hypothetical protein
MQEVGSACFFKLCEGPGERKPHLNVFNFERVLRDKHLLGAGVGFRKFRFEKSDMQCLFL